MPTGRDLYQDVPLSNMAVSAFDTGLNGEYIASSVFPIVNTSAQGGNYWIIEKEAFLRQHNSQRSPGTNANLIEFDVSSDTYFAGNYALASEIPLEDLTNADNALMLRGNSSDLILSGLLRDYEVRVANTVTSISNVGSGQVLTGTDKWSDFANSSPLSDVTTGHAFIRRQTGLMANTAIIDADSLSIVRRHPELLDLYKYTSGGQVDMSQLAEAFGVERLLVGKGIKITSAEGAATSVTANIWGNSFVLARIVPTVGLKTQTLGVTMRWQPAGFAAPMQVTRQQFTGAGTKNVEVVETSTYQDEKIVARDLAYTLNAIL